MKKSLKIVKTIAMLLVVILLVVIAFCGLYVKKSGLWENKIPDFKFGMELDGYRELRFVLDDSENEKEVFVDSNGNYAGNVKEQESEEKETNLPEEEESLDPNIAKEIEAENVVAEENKTTKSEETEDGYFKETRVIKANEDKDINIKNFALSKNIIQKRLESIDSNEYNIRQDLVTGEIVLEVPDNDNVSLEEYYVTKPGKVEIIDYQTGLILIDNSMLKNAKSFVSTNDGKYQVYLQLEFNKKGAEILNRISKEYVKTIDESGEEKVTRVSVTLDGQSIIDTSFGVELDAIMQIPLGKATSDYQEYLEIAKEVSMIQSVISSETMPLVYKLSSDNYIQSYITTDYIVVAMIVSAVIIFVISIYLIIKFKLEGLKSAIISIGYIALLSLTIRYTNVLITLNSVIAFILIVIINYIFNIKYLKNLKENEKRSVTLIKTMKELYLAIIPVCIVAVIFTFMSSVIISSIGMTLFWGLVIQVIYNCILCI